MTHHGFRRMTAWLIQAVVFCAGACVADARAGEVIVAVAANVSGPMQKIATHFEQDTGHQAKLVVGSTGKLYAQIKNGAPFDVLLAADDETPRKLEQENLAVPGTRVTYAIGRLALWSAQPGVVDDKGEVLRQNRDARLAIADARLAPYGAAALQVLDKLKLREAWQARWVQGENIAQTWQFVATGNATLGFVALSQVWVDGRLTQGSMWLVPESLHDSLRQDAVLLVRGQDNEAARSWLSYVRGTKARAVLRNSGYSF